MSFKSLLKKYIVLPALAYVEEEVLEGNDQASQNDQLEGIQTFRRRNSRAKNCTEANNCDA